MEVSNQKMTTKISQGRSSVKLFAFEKFRNQRLMTVEGQIGKRKFLSDESFIDEAFDFLGNVDTLSSIEERIENAMAYVDFLAEALVWDDNPVRDLLVERVGAFLRSPLIGDLEEDVFRHSVAVDKAELYLLLKKVAPAEAASLKTQARGTKLARVIFYAENHM